MWFIPGTPHYNLPHRQPHDGTGSGMMKHAIRQAVLLAACSLLCACALVQQLQRLPHASDLQSSGTAGGDTPVTILAISTNPALSSDEAVDSTQDQPAFTEASRFFAAFARDFAARFAQRLEAFGVQPHNPGQGIPLLRVRALAYRQIPNQNCLAPGQKDACPAEVQIEGTLIDSGGARVWSYSSWVATDEMNADGYEDYYKRLLNLMHKDQVIPPAAG